MSNLISLQNLKNILEKSISDYESIHGSSDIEVSDDLYWKIPDPSLADMSTQPSNFEVGNLQEEVESLLVALAEGRLVGAESLSYLSGLLQWLSYKAGE